MDRCLHIYSLLSALIAAELYQTTITDLSIHICVNNIKTSMNNNGQSSAKIRPTWLHGRPNQPWSDIWPPYHRLTVVFAMRMHSNSTGRQWSVAGGCQQQQFIQHPCTQLTLSRLFAVVCGNCTSHSKSNFSQVVKCTYPESRPIVNHCQNDSEMGATMVTRECEI